MNYQEKWARNVTALKDFVENHGHANVPSAFSVSAADGKEVFLGPWVSKIRSQYRSGKILPHRARELEDIPGWHWEASRPGPRVSAGRDAQIAERYEAGETTRQIADALSLTTQRVNQILRRSGK
ncbi:MAG: helicase associated domain-containing protein [bacterium]